MTLNTLSGKVAQSSSSLHPQVTASTTLFAKKMAMILGLTAGIHATSALAQEIPPTPVSNDTNVTLVEYEVKKQNSETSGAIKFSKALPGESVVSFMRRSFGEVASWNLLIEKESGKRVFNPNTDLIAGKEYMLAKDEKQAQNLVNILQKRKAQKATPSQPVVQETPKSTPPTFLGFDYTKYLQAISIPESNGKYSANNVKKGKALNISSEKHAFGKYQFTKETLSLFGVKTQQEREHFLTNPELQEEIMKKFTFGNYQYALENPFIRSLLSQGVHMHEILSSMHHRGSKGVKDIAKISTQTPNPRATFFSYLEGLKGDWLGTKTSTYVSLVNKHYQSYGSENLKFETQLAHQKVESPSMEMIHQASKAPPKKMVSTVAANENTFEPETTLQVSGNLELKPEISLQMDTQLGEKISPETSLELPKTIELKEQISPVEVSTVLKQLYKKEILSKLSQDASLTKEFRENLVAKLSKIDDLAGYYQKQIDYYQNIIGTSSNELDIQRAKRILPGLQKLMNDTTRTVLASNQELQTQKKIA